MAEIEIENLKVNLSNEKTRNLELVKELKDLRSCCTCTKESSLETTSAKVHTKFESEIELEGNKFSEVCEVLIAIYNIQTEAHIYVLSL